MNTVPFTVSSKKIQYLRINPTNVVKGFYSGSFKPSKKEVVTDSRKWKDMPCSWIVRISIVKITILPKGFYILNSIPVKNPHVILCRNRQYHLKIHVELQRTSGRQNNPEQKEQGWRGSIPDLKIYCRVMVINPVWQ